MKWVLLIVIIYNGQWSLNAVSHDTLTDCLSSKAVIEEQMKVENIKVPINGCFSKNDWVHRASRYVELD